MLIFNMGIPRSGTTLVLNVLRGIHEKMARKCRVLNPGTGAEVDTAIDTEQQNENLILHCHVITDKVIERSRRPGCAAIFNIRDPRDVVVSQMKLHDVGLESAIQMTVAAFGSLEAATRIPNLMIIPYSHITDHADALIFQIGMKLGKYLTPSDIKTIRKQTSVERHKQKMQHVIDNAGASDSGVKQAFSGVRNVQYDEETLITDRHIQSGKTGRWKDELDAGQQTIVNNVFLNIVKQLGFE